MESNLFCDQPNCGLPAQGFGLRNGLKEKCCSNHSYILLSKKVTVHDISAYGFIEGMEDVPEYEKRRKQTDKGLGNLTTLETRCETEFSGATKLLDAQCKRVTDVVQRCFEEAKRSVQNQYEDAKQQLFTLKENMRQYLTRRDAVLQPKASQICGKINFEPNCLRFAMADASLVVAKGLMESWRCRGLEWTFSCFDTQKRGEVINTLLAEAKDERKLGQFALEALEAAEMLGCTKDGSDLRSASQRKLAEDAIHLEELLPLTADAASAKKAAQAWLDLGHIEKSAQRFLEYLKCAQSAWELLQAHNVSDKDVVTVGLELGPLLWSYAGRFTDAESVFKRALEVETTLSYASVDSMHIYIAVAESFFNCGRYSDAQKKCEAALQNFANESHPAELYWSALLYLVLALDVQGNIEQAEKVVDQWQKRGMTADGGLYQTLKSCVLAVYNKQRGDLNKAESLFAEALTDVDFLTTSTAALARHLLGKLQVALTRSEKAESSFLHAESLYKQLAPYSLHAANNHRCLGILYRKLKRWQESRTHFLQAQGIYQVVGPQSPDAATNLECLGKLCEDEARIEEAETYYKLARGVFDSVGSQTLPAGRCYKRSALYYHRRQRYAEAERCFQQAQRALNASAPNSLRAARNYHLTALLYKDMKRLDSAENLFLQAQEIYDSLKPRPMAAAENSYQLGLLYRATKKLVDAEKHFQAAQRVFSAGQQSLASALNFLQLGLLYKDIKKFEDSEHCFQRAVKNFDAVAPESLEAAKALTNLGILYRKQKQLGKSECHLKLAEQLFQATAGQSLDAACNYYNLGLLLLDSKRITEAESYFLQAQRTFDSVAPTSLDCAKNHTSLGLLYRDLKQLPVAEGHLRAAQNLYNSLAPRAIRTAQNWRYLGQLYEAMGRASDVVASYEAARNIFAANGATAEVAAIEQRLKSLSQTSCLIW